MEVNYPLPQQAPPPQPAPLYNKFLERGRVGLNEPWRYVVGTIITFAGYFAIGLPVALILAAAAYRKGITAQDELQSAATNPAALGMDPNLLFFLLLLIFVGAMAGLLVAVRYLHKKPILSIVTSSTKIRWGRFWIAFVALLLLSAIWTFITYQEDPNNVRYTFQLRPFIISAILACTLLPAQTWWEEFMMRGYLLQGLGLRTKSAWIPILLTSVIFGLLHSGNPEVAANGFWKSMPLYILPGLLFGIIAVLDEGLEIPMGLHLANNLFGTLVITNDTSAIQASTIWRQNHPDPTLDFYSLLILPTLLMLFWAIYKWDVKKLYVRYA